MSHPVLGPQALQGRTQNHTSQLMTLWVTRQDQEFIVTNDLEFCDVELINATCELVGEPGTGFNGSTVSSDTPATTTQNFHQTTINKLLVNEQGTKHTVLGRTEENRIQTKSSIHHGHVNVFINGLTKGHHFRQDIQHVDNRLELVIPTDLGLESARQQLSIWPPSPIKLERVKLEQRLRVSTVFIGNGPIESRISRFVEDWADGPNGKRNTDKTVQYINTNDEQIASTDECIVPSNCIKALKLVFVVTPRMTF